MARIFLFESGMTGWGGSFKSCYFMASALKKRGHSVFVGCVNESDYWNKLNNQDVPTIEFIHRFYSLRERNRFINRMLKIIDKYLHIFFYLPLFLDRLWHKGFIAQVNRFISENEINIVHTNTNFIRDKEAFWAAKNNGIPLICHLRKEPYRKLTSAEIRMASYEKAQFIAISKSIMDNWIKAGLPKEKIHLIYNAQPKLSSEEILEARESKDNLTRLLFVGRLTKIKGMDILIKALKNIDKKKWHLTIIGEGPEKSIIEDAVGNSDFSDNVDFLGYQENVGKYYASNDILIVPSIREPFGRVIIEAMQFGLPVIASNIDGPAEIIEHDKDGFLFEVGNAKQLGEIIAFLINNPQKRFEVGLAGKAKQNIFSEEVFMEKLMKVYTDLLNMKK